MNLRITKKRKEILDVLQSNHRTLSAADIHKKLPEIDLVTIYRNLELFVEEKLIKRIHLGTGQVQFEYQDEPHHHAVCIECEKIIHFTAPDAKLKKLLGIENFEVDEIEVTVRGVCAQRHK